MCSCVGLERVRVRVRVRACRKEKKGITVNYESMPKMCTSFGINQTVLAQLYENSDDFINHQFSFGPVHISSWR